MVLEADVMLGKFASDNWTPPVLTITLAIQRQSHFYNTIFFTPFFGELVHKTHNDFTNSFFYSNLNLRSDEFCGRPLQKPENFIELFSVGISHCSTSCVSSYCTKSFGPCTTLR